MEAKPSKLQIVHCSRVVGRCEVADDLLARRPQFSG